MRNVRLFCIGILLAVLLLPVSALCAGGVYVDNITVSLNTAPVFQESFSVGTLLSWSKLTDATLFSDSVNRCLFINRHGPYAATAYHNVAIDHAQLVTVNFILYVTPREQQYDCRKGGSASFYITLYSSRMSGQRTDELIKGVVIQNPCQTGCMVGFAPGGKLDSQYGAKAPVLPVGKWVGVTLEIDAAKGAATMAVDGKQVASMPYSGGNGPVQEMSFISQFGDGSRRSN